MNETFKKIKDAKDKDAADLFLQKILPLSGGFTLLLEPLLIRKVIDSLQFSTAGLLKPFQNLQPGSRAGYRTAGPQL
jgi:hypothetical protein